MIGRTNVLSLGSGGGGVTTVDLPTHPESVSAASRSQKVIISLTYSDTDYISGVEVRYKADGYPTSPTDGEGVTAEGAAASIEVSGLTNGITYYFRVYLYREIGGVKYYQTDDTNSTASGIPSTIGVEGILPAIVADNYILIDTSGTFTIDIPDNLSVTVYLVGGGCNGGNGSEGYYDEDYGNTDGSPGQGGYGGKYVAKSLLKTGSISCTSTIGTRSRRYSSPTVTSLTVGSTTYSTSSGAQSTGTGLSTPYGYVGSRGGNGGDVECSGSYGGVGAGKGGDGGTYDRYDVGGYPGTTATNYGCGGGGGGAGAASGDYYGSGGSGGAGKQGCVIFGW